MPTFTVIHDGDPDDLEDILLEIEKSFAVTLEEDVLLKVKTFGELCEHIAQKMLGQEVDDCTHQQAFYKIRGAFQQVIGADLGHLHPHASLESSFPAKQRRKKTREVEKLLGFRLGILAWHAPLLICSLVGLCVSFGLAFLGMEYSFYSFCLSGFGIFLSSRLGNSLVKMTWGDLAKKMTRYHYTQCRRNPNTYNPQEIYDILQFWFADQFGYKVNQLQPSTPIM